MSPARSEIHALADGSGFLELDLASWAKGNVSKEEVTIRQAIIEGERVIFLV